KHEVIEERELVGKDVNGEDLGGVEVEEKETAFSASVGLQGVVGAGLSEEIGSGLNSDGKSPFVVDSDGSLPFYMLDAYEEFYGSNAGNIYLFGKVKAGNAYHSCCVVVKNMQRCIYAIPSGPVFDEAVILKLQESKVSPTDFLTKLHEMASGLKADLTKQLLERNVSNFSMKPVKRNYAFERSDIERKEH
ncbi:hypothetical protein M8C21_009775, partial [Ambrosia artemisiifolia]